MPIHVGHLDSATTAFGLSPAHELLRSLHVLLDLEHHPLHISWALRARAGLTADLKQDIDSFGFWLRRRPPLFPRIWPYTETSVWADQLSAFRAAPVEDFAEELIHGALLSGQFGPRLRLRQFRDRADLQERALVAIEAAGPASLPLMHELIAEPERCRDRFARLLSDYWDCCLARHWPRLAGQLEHDIANRGRALSDRGLARMLGELSHQVSVDQRDNSVIINAPSHRRRAPDPLELSLTDDDEVVLLPSHFTWPELHAAVHRERNADGERQTVLITYAVEEMQRQASPASPPEELLKLLRAAGDPTRLRILQLIAGRSRSTREIAGLVQLTEAAVSKQLKVLHRAGWVTPYRNGHYAYHRLNRGSLGRMMSGLEALFS